MSLNDYSNETDYYEQGFEKEGVVSIWVGLLDNTDEPDEVDALQDLCGVGYYNLDDQESNSFDYEVVPLNQLLEDISYSESFIKEALIAAQEKDIAESRWVVVQYDFEYNPKKVSRKVSDDPVFIGVFKYDLDDDDFL